MARIELTAGDDTYVQAEANKNDWNDVHGLAGNDSFTVYQGDVEGGKGNDRIERVPVPGETWRNVGAAYWDSPAGVTVNLADGWADDGWGGRDTLVNITGVHGTGYNDVFVGSAADNYFWANGGKDVIDGGAGTDSVGIGWFQPLQNGEWRQALLSELDIKVGVDGETAVVKSKGAGTNFEYQLTRVEYIEVPLVTGGNHQRVLLSDYLSQQDMAQQAIEAGGVARWNAPQSVGSSVNVSYSFFNTAPANGVGAAGFRAFSAAEQQVVRDLLAKTAVFSGISFTEVASGGQMRFGASQQAETRGVSWLPDVANGDQAGDVWMDIESMLDLSAGSEGYAVLLHEVGHALGLRHPRNTDTGDAWSVQLRASDDRTSLTAMSETRSSDGLFRADWGMLDVLALRHLYGGKLVNAGDNVYKLGAAQASAQTTLIDDGGNDTIDASAYAIGVSLNLKPGGVSNVGLTAIGNAGVENLGITATTVIENAIGSPFDDVLTGNDADNRLTGGFGNDWIDGGSGTDTAVFVGKLSDYTVTTAFGKVFVEAKNGRTGFDTLLNVEKLAFDDRTYSVGQAMGGVASSDFNGDGKSDLLWRNGASGEGAIWLGAAAADGQAVAGVSNLKWSIVGMGDFDGDGKSDLLWRNADTGEGTIWKSGSAATPMAVASVVNLNWKVVGVGDFDGDGKSDILWRSATSGEGTIWKGGSASTPMDIAAVVNLNWKVAGIGDFDGDGKSDILWRSAITGEGTIWKGGSASTPMDVAAVVNLNWKVVGIGDFDGDGKSDLLWRNDLSGQATIWKSASAATPMDVLSVSNLNWRIAAVGDYDGDGKSDLLWRNGTTGESTIWKGASASAGMDVLQVSNLNWKVIGGAVTQLGDNGVSTLAVSPDELLSFAGLPEQHGGDALEAVGASSAALPGAAIGLPGLDAVALAQSVDFLTPPTDTTAVDHPHHQGLWGQDYLLA